MLRVEPSSDFWLRTSDLTERFAYTGGLFRSGPIDRRWCQYG